ncbi:MAG: stalk domain-containing protein, partial [Firmicutes bacterium]|nr:stalk domain-containing protein [Bacillota bacterium]
MRRRIFFFVCAVLLLNLVSAAGAAAGGAKTVVLTIGAPAALVDGTSLPLEAAPRVMGSSTMAPLRFVTEAFGATVDWDNQAGKIILRQGDQEIYLQPNLAQATVNGAVKSLPAAPVVENGVTLVPLRFLAEQLNYGVNFSPATGEITIKQLPPPNRPPVAQFQVEKEAVAQGETVYYDDRSYDPDEGDYIIDSKWTGKQRAFFAPGQYPVTLAVEDSQGHWSEPFTRIITVTPEIKMDRLTYNLNNPIAGEPVGGIPGLSVLDLAQVTRADRMENADKLEIMVSNSPEIVHDNGILFSYNLKGTARFYYHHINGSNENKRIYPLVTNQSNQPVRLIIKRAGIAGPGDAMYVGRVAAYRYLAFSPTDAQMITLQPGQKYLLNGDKNSLAKPNDVVHGMFDIEAQGELTFEVISNGVGAAAEDESQLSVVRSDDIHVRGAFPLANRYMSVQLDGEEPSRLIVADGSQDV